MKTHLGHYEIVSELGRGGMGVVYKGYEPALGRYVAIKELSPALAHDPVVVERFLREARSMALLSEPHIIQIHFIGQQDGQPFFVMEFVDGISVAALIKRDGRLSAADALKIVHQTAQGLSAAHDHGVIHRDIKPPNVMINRRGLVKIGDFGIALANQDLSSKLTSKGELVGTPGYLAPEILKGNPVDQRTDVYALGVVLFEMLTGRTPFADASVYDLMQAVMETEVPDVREYNAEIQAEVAAIVATMLAKDPARRYQNMRELIVDLERLPRADLAGPVKVTFSAANESNDTQLNVPLAITPRAASQGSSTPPPPGRRESATPLPEASRRAAVTPPHLAASAAAAPTPRGQSRAAAPAPVPVVASRKGGWNVLIMAALMFAAGASWGLRGEISAALAGFDRQEAAYAVAAVVAGLALLISGYWFGLRRWRRREQEAGIASLANLKWRECVGLVLEAMRRDGFDAVPSSEQPGDGGNNFLLHRGPELVLLSYKHGTAYRIDEADLREFTGEIQMQGAGRGIIATLGSVELSSELVKRYGIELLDGAALWPKVRPFVPASLRQQVRRQSMAQTWKGLAVGAAVSMLLGAATYLITIRMPVDENTQAAAAPTNASSAADAAAAVSAAADRQRIGVAAAAMAQVATLTDAERVQRRADALKQVKEDPRIKSTGWSSESTLLLVLNDSDGKDKELGEKVCGILVQFEELRLTRLQLQPPVSSNTPIHWRQCQ